MAKERQNHGALSKKVLEKIVRDAHAYGIKSLHFSGGGEPLTNQHLIPVMRLARNLGITVILSTNGVYLNQDVVDSCDHIRISLDAATRETHEKIHRVETFDTIMNNIKSIKKQDYQKIGLGFVATVDNYYEANKFCMLSLNLGVSFVHIRPAWLPNNPPIQKLIMREIRMNLPEDFSYIIPVYCQTDKFDGTWTPRLYSECRATPLLACIKANGHFCVCQDRTDLEFGDYNTQSFLEIWDSAEHKEAIERIKLEECPRCVETKKNEYIEQIFVRDNCLMGIQ